MSIELCPVLSLNFPIPSVSKPSPGHFLIHLFEAWLVEPSQPMRPQGSISGSVLSEQSEPVNGQKWPVGQIKFTSSSDGLTTWPACGLGTCDDSPQINPGEQSPDTEDWPWLMQKWPGVQLVHSFTFFASGVARNVPIGQGNSYLKVVPSSQ